jgi:hypothetical protein
VIPTIARPPTSPAAPAPAAPRLEAITVAGPAAPARAPLALPAPAVADTVVNTVNTRSRPAEAGRAAPRIEARGGAAAAAPTPEGAAIAAASDASTTSGGAAGDHAESPPRAPEKADEAAPSSAHARVDGGASTPSAPAARSPGDAARVDENRATNDAERREASPRQEAVTVAVNRMALRHGAHAEVDVPELGRLTVDARSRGADVDVAVSVDRAHGAAALRAASPELAAYLRDAHVPLARLSVEPSVSGGTSGGDGDRSRQPRSNDDRGGDPRATPDPAQRGDPRRRVRFVL